MDKNHTLDSIGARIKTLRRMKNLTQAQLAGNEITRNMLSRIESGAALPSLGTLVYIAHRLEVPSGCLIDEEVYFDYLRAELVKNVKSHMDSGEYLKALELIKTSGLKGDEITLLIIECDLKIAEAGVTSSKYKEAFSFLSDALAQSHHTLYNTAGSAYVANLYYTLMSRSMLPSVDGEAHTAPPADFDKYIDLYIYLRITDLFDNGQIIKAVNLASLCELSDKILSTHIAARLDMANGRYNDAESKLKSIVQSEKNSPTTHGSIILFRVYSELEQCAKGENDFVSAYQYKEEKLKLFELASGIKL